MTAKKSKKVNYATILDVAQKNLFNALSARTASISESKFADLQKNNVSRLKQSEKFKALSDNVLKLIAAHCDDVSFLVGAETPIKTANRLTQIAAYLCDEKTSNNAIFTISCIQRLHKQFESVDVHTLINSTTTDKGVKQADAMTTNFIKALQFFNVINIQGATHSCGANFVARLDKTLKVSFNDEVLKQYDLIK